MFGLVNPDQPHLIGAYDTPGTALDVLVSGAYLYVADNDGGLIVLRQIALANRIYLPLVAVP
ncbi:MAG: hypothetical protein HC822_16210 [Oscillochloris sp.]|nr:hypothetical protein [Oscillochloris sp.]